MSYDNFLDLVDKTFNNFNWRYGQCIMNVLSYAWKQKYDELADSEYDCYYDDSIVKNTLFKLQKEWILSS